MRAFVVDEPRTGALRALNYAPAVERIRLAGSGSSTPLRRLAGRFGDSYGTVFTRLDCAAEMGVSLFSQTDTFAAEPMGRTIRRDSMSHPERHEVRPWQVLICGAGQMGEGNLFGQAMLADSRLVGGYLGPDTFAVDFEEPGSDLNLWAYAFLCTHIGRLAISSTAYGTSIPHIRADLLGSLPIPHAPRETVASVARLVRHAAHSRERFYNDLQHARSIVASVPEARAAAELCAGRARRVVSWSGPFPTLSAWTYASTGGALDLLRRSWTGRVGDVVRAGGIFRGGRGPRVACQPPHGVDFLSQRDAFLIRPVPQRVLLPSSGLVPHEGTIMVGGQGTLGEGEIFGRATIVTAGGSRQAWTEHLLRIVPTPSEASTLFAYLTTTVGFRLLRSTAVGTKLLSMRPDLIRALPIPDLTDDERSRVDALVRSSLEARSAADTAEAEAIRIIEQEVLPQWLA